MSEESDLAIKKIIDPKASNLVEEVYMVGETYSIYTDISGSSFSGSFSTTLGTLEVERSILVGEQWEWTDWGSTSTYVTADCANGFCTEIGNYLFSADEIDGSTLLVYKAYHRKDVSESTFTIEEVLNIVEEDVFDEAVLSLQ